MTNNERRSVVHAERGFRVVEVVKPLDGAQPLVVGYQLDGPGMQSAPLFATEGEAVAAIPGHVVPKGA